MILRFNNGETYLTVERYHFGYVVVDQDGVALSRAFETLKEAKKWIREYKKSQ